MNYETTTQGISVRVEPSFVEDESTPVRDQYFWAYTVEIYNGGAETVKLVSRYWLITDAFGRSQEVRGPGVVGEQPVLEPGESFRYTSGAPLKAPSGIMQGHYVMETEDAESFEVKIPAFSLDSPYIVGMPN
ncbi:MAG: Co2+/Mg2+ efflux protein ApaG [Hyphomicrobiales bacterium]|nr:Co2+/Mg2+ efflux protein ApaG [Hyphomicrobiales bacterium]